MKIKSTCSLALMVAAGSLLVTSSSLRASDTDDRIESSAKKSYVFKTYLKHDSIKIESKNGAVLLTGTVAEASQKSLAENTVESLPGVKSVDNQLTVKGESPAEHSDGWLGTKVPGPGSGWSLGDPPAAEVPTMGWERVRRTREEDAA